MPPSGPGDLFSSADAAAIAFARQYVLESAEAWQEYYAYIYKVGNRFTFHEPGKLSNTGGTPKPLSDYGLEWDTVVAFIHTHGYPNLGNKWDSRFSTGGIGTDGSYLRNSCPGTGMYLAAPNGSVQFWSKNIPVGPAVLNMIRVVSTDTPIVPGVAPYTTGSEQLYREVITHTTSLWDRVVNGAPRYRYENIRALP